MRRCTLWIGIFLIPAMVAGQEKADPDIEKALAKEIIGPRKSLIEASDYLDLRIPRMPQVESIKEWEKEAERLRMNILVHVIYRGAAPDWRDAKCQVEWLDTIE